MPTWIHLMTGELPTQRASNVEIISMTKYLINHLLHKTKELSAFVIEMEKSIALVVLLSYCISCSELMLHDFQVWFQCIDPQQKENEYYKHIYIYIYIYISVCVSYDAA